MDAEVKATIIGLISIAISLLALNFEQSRLAIIILYSVALVGYFLFSYLAKIEQHEKEIQKLKESFKRAEDLINIKIDIENIKRRLK